MPPSRYRVVEKGRRLIVIDTLSGTPVTGPAPLVAAPRRRLEMPASSTPVSRAAPASAMPRAGANEIRTARWYDGKGPRTIPLSPEGQRKWQTLQITFWAALAILIVTAFWFWPMLFVMGFIAMRKEARATLRKGTTRTLDTINQA